MRAGLRALIDAIPGVEVVAEAGEGREALAAVHRERPEVLVTDVTMAGMNGLELAERVRAELPATRVIVLSMYSSEEYVIRALKAGASAYLLKDSATAELALALEAAARGETYLSPGASQRLVAHVAGTAEPAGPLDALTAPARNPDAHRRGRAHQGDRPPAGNLSQDRRGAPRATHGAPENPRHSGTRALRHPHRARLVRSAVGSST